MARSEYQRAKSTAASWFGKWVRVRDCIRMTGTLTDGICITCGKPFTYSKLQCGHFVPSRRDSLIFEEHNAAAQCYMDNVRRQGAWVEFEMELLKRYGPDEVQRLKMLKFIDFKYSVEELRDIATKYREAFHELCQGL